MLRHSTSIDRFRAGLMAGLAVGLVTGIGFGLAAGIAAGIVFALVVVVLVVVHVIGLMWKLVSQPAPDSPNPLTPRTSWRSDLALNLVAGFGVGLGDGVLAWSAGKPVYVPAAAGLAIGLLLSMAWAASLTFAQLAARWHTPVRLMRFLEDAHKRNVLRTVGPIYQFRHARLQDRLAEQAGAATENLGDGAAQGQ